MRTSEKTDKLCPALAKAYLNLTDPQVDAENDHFDSKYAKLSTGTAIVRPVLAAEDLFYVQGAKKDPEGWVLVTRIVHSSGQWQETDYPLITDKNPQKQASANTYARRHALFAALGLAPIDDDDGKTASSTQSKEDAEKAYQDGAAAGRRWAVQQYFDKKKVDGFNGVSFASKLKKAGVPHSLELVKMWRIYRGMQKPSLMKAADREGLAALLASAKGKAAWKEFEKACGPLPRKKAKKPPTLSETLTKVNLTLDDVRGFCEFNKRPKPEEMDDEQRAVLIGWLTTKKDGATGADAVVTWLESQGGE